MVISSKILMSAEMMSMYLTLSKKKDDIRRFRDYTRSDSEKQDIKNKRKLTFLLILTNKVFRFSRLLFIFKATF